MAAVRAALPAYEAYWLHWYNVYTTNTWTLTEKLQSMNATGFNGKNDLAPGAISSEVAALRAAGFSTHVWTIDAADQAIAYAAMGIDSLTSNRARDMLDNVRGEMVPHAWLDGYPALLAQHGGHYRNAAMAATGKLTLSGREMRVWEDYVAGTAPDNPSSRLRCLITVADGVPKISWTPDLGTTRRYTVYGKARLDDPSWTTATNHATRFFKVEASLP